MATTSATAVRSGTIIAINCLTTLLPASLTLVRTDIITSPSKRKLLTLPRMILGILMPQLMLFAAVTDFGRAWIIQHRVNAAAKACYVSQPSRSTIRSSNDDLGLQWINDFWDYLKPHIGSGIVRFFLFRVLRRVALVLSFFARLLCSREPDVYDLVKHANNHHCRTYTYNPRRAEKF